MFLFWFNRRKNKRTGPSFYNENFTIFFSFSFISISPIRVDRNSWKNDRKGRGVGSFEFIRARGGTSTVLIKVTDRMKKRRSREKKEQVVDKTNEKPSILWWLVGPCLPNLGSSPFKGDRDQSNNKSRPVFFCLQSYLVLKKPKAFKRILRHHLNFQFLISLSSSLHIETRRQVLVQSGASHTTSVSLLLLCDYLNSTWWIFQPTRQLLWLFSPDYLAPIIRMNRVRHGWIDFFQ